MEGNNTRNFKLSGAVVWLPSIFKGRTEDGLNQKLNHAKSKKRRRTSRSKFKAISI